MSRINQLARTFQEHRGALRLVENERDEAIAACMAAETAARQKEEQLVEAVRQQADIFAQAEAASRQRAEFAQQQVEAIAHREAAARQHSDIALAQSRATIAELQSELAALRAASAHRQLYETDITCDFYVAPKGEGSFKRVCVKEYFLSRSSSLFLASSVNSASTP